MAFIGMRHVVCAEFDSHTDGSEPTYKITGKDVGKAISANLTINRNSNPLYADDVLAEDDNGITSIDIEIGVDDVGEDVQAYMGIMQSATAGTPSVTTYYDTADSSTPVGLGYIRVRRKGDTTTYQAVWIYKVMMTKSNETSQTKGESVEWQTATLTGKASGLNISASFEKAFRKIQNFDSESTAAAWLDALASISRT